MSTSQVQFITIFFEAVGVAELVKESTETEATALGKFSKNWFYKWLLQIDIYSNRRRCFNSTTITPHAFDLKLDIMIATC